MFEYLSFRWKLTRIERARRKTERSYERDLAKARQQRLNVDELQSLEATARFEDETYRDEIMRLHTRFLAREANRLLVPMPHFGDEELWEERNGHFWLSPKGVNSLRSAIRSEKKAKRETVLMWVPAITALTGLFGALIGVLAAWFGISLSPK